MSRIFALHDDKDKRGKGAFPIFKKSDIERLNKDGFGIFWAVNKFKGNLRQEVELEKLEFWFVDLDGGSKDKQWQKILAFPIEPSIIVETKNGHHVYWQIENDLFQEQGREIAIKNYKNILEALVKWFDADKNAKGVTRILRLPNYYHMKNPSEPFLIKTIFEQDAKINYTTMYDALEKLELFKIEEQPKREITYTPTENDFWERAFNYDCVSGLYQLSGASELRSNVIEFVDRGAKKAFIVDGKICSSIWIDENGRIGSNDKGGPSLINWVMWYGYDNSTAAQILKKYIPDLREDFSCLKNFIGV